MLTLIACNQCTSPRTVARAEGPLAYVEHSASGKHGTDSFHSFFNTATGDLWWYDPGQDGVSYAGRVLTKVSQPRWTHMGRVTKLGEPLLNALPRKQD